MSEEPARPRGRPRSFDERKAIERAVQVFWTKGYDAVTIDDLVAGMGVARPSLYAIFGDKATLFMRCLEAYAEHLGAGASKALFGPPGVGDGILGFLSHIVQSATKDHSPRGCLVGCVAPAVDDPKVRDFLARGNAQGVALVEQRLRRGVDAGELPSDFPTAARARQVIDLSRGLAFRARVGVSRAQLLRDAKGAAVLVLEPNGTQLRGKRTPRTPRARAGTRQRADHKQLGRELGSRHPSRSTKGSLGLLGRRKQPPIAITTRRSPRLAPTNT